jgi:hypothetical protein
MPSLSWSSHGASKGVWAGVSGSPAGSPGQRARTWASSVGQSRAGGRIDSCALPSTTSSGNCFAVVVSEHVAHDAHPDPLGTFWARYPICRSWYLSDLRKYWCAVLGLN